MIRIYTALFAVLVAAGHAQQPDANPFIGPQGLVVENTEWPGKFSRIVAVAYDYTREKEQEVVVDGRLHTGVFATSADLSKAQEEALFSAITGTHTPLKSAMCFEPHHGFIFYDEGGVVVGSISVCFGCRNYRLSPRGEVSRRWDWPGLKALLEDLKIPFPDDYTKAYEKSKSQQE